MPRTLSRMKGRRSGEPHFSMLVHAYFESPEYARLSPRAVKALIDLWCQFRGANNGDLCATFKLMRVRGWTSNDQLQKALRELLDAGWLVATRQGGRHRPTLYAVTFMPINECGGKLDVSPTRTALHSWKRPGESTAPVICLGRRAAHIEPLCGAKEAA